MLLNKEKVQYQTRFRIFYHLSRLSLSGTGPAISVRHVVPYSHGVGVPWGQADAELNSEYDDTFQNAKKAT